MFKALAITDKGLEKVAALEVKEQAKAVATLEDSCVSFEAKSLQDLMRLCYFSQASDRIIVLLASFEFSDYEDLMAKAGKEVTLEMVKEWLPQGASFRVECERRGLHDFGSNTLEQDVGGIIIDHCTKGLGFEPKVDLKSPAVQFFAFANNDRLYFGVDLCGRDLSKREYRIFTAPGIVNAKLAYAMVRLSGYTRKKSLVDLYSKAGIIAIEAALHENKVSASKYGRQFIFRRLPALKGFDFDAFFRKLDSEKKDEPLQVTGFDPILRNLEAAKKNAKLAGVDKMVRFSKMDLEWVDSKLGESEVDLVISRIPVPSHQVPEGAIRKIYKELFYQAEFFLKGGGRLCVLAESLLLLREMLTPEFRVVSDEQLWSGKQDYEFMVLERLPKKQ